MPLYILLSIFSFIATILFLAFAYAIAKEVRRTKIKRKISYELMLIEKAIIIMMCAGILSTLPTDLMDTLVMASFIVSILIITLVPPLLLIKKVNRRAYLNVKRIIRKIL
jgi:uncharacterized membrane protein